MITDGQSSGDNTCNKGIIGGSLEPFINGTSDKGVFFVGCLLFANVSVCSLKMFDCCEDGFY